MTLQKELFPWSPFPMYSGVNSGKELKLLSAYLVSPNNQEVPLEQVLILRPKYEYRWRIDAEQVWSREPHSDEVKTLTRFAEIFKDDLADKKNSYQSLRFYLEYWSEFTGPRRHNPDQRRLILEYPLH